MIEYYNSIKKKGESMHRCKGHKVPRGESDAQFISTQLVHSRRCFAKKSKTESSGWLLHYVSL